MRFLGRKRKKIKREGKKRSLRYAGKREQLTLRNCNCKNCRGKSEMRGSLNGRKSNDNRRSLRDDNKKSKGESSGNWRLLG